MLYSGELVSDCVDTNGAVFTIVSMLALCTADAFDI